MADVRITIDRSNPDGPIVTVGAMPGTDASTFEQAKPKIQAVLDALGLKGVKFQKLTEIEQHVHPENTLIVAQPQIRHSH